jgi:tetratricopeptide (TPR) repeat protein
MTDFKAKGNDAYKDGKFDEAIGWYTKAIDEEPRNAVYFNNRAAAYMALKRYGEAASDAEKSAILSPTAKANARHGKALWNLNRHQDALAAYERAARLEPANREFTDAITQLKALVAGRGASPQGRPAAGPHQRAMQLDIAVIAGAVFYVLFLFFSPSLSLTAWRGLLLAMGLRQIMVIARAAGANELRTFGFWKNFVMSRALTEFAGQYLFLCLALLLTGSAPQQFLAMAMALYAAVDLATEQRPLVLSLVQGSRLEAMLLPRLDQVRANTQQLLLQAGACEALSLFMLPLSGGGFIGIIVTSQFVKQRYLHDAWAKQAWRGLYQQVGQLTRHARCPRVVNTVFEKIAGFLHRASGAPQ